MSGARDYEWMARALRLAEKARCSTAPNPAVGCVLVAGGRVVGEGFTRPPGGPHAEVVALEAAGAQARGASAYVTLEPCDHTGRTGPCSAALIEAGVARAVIATLDPNPAAGRGVDALRAAGIDVEIGVLEEAAKAVNRGFFARVTRGRPWVRSKLAASLDGRTALAAGESRWITGEAARADVHRWRARSDAVLTGSGTLLHDDPALTARVADADVEIAQPRRVIVDSALRTPAAAKTLALPGEVVIFTTLADGPAWLESGGRVRVERVGGEARCDLREVLERLAAREVNDVWVEAGPGLNGALLDRGLVDELVMYVAPQLLGDTARGMFSIAPLASLADRIELAIDDVRRVGPDLRIIARPT